MSHTSDERPVPFVPETTSPAGTREELLEWLYGIRDHKLPIDFKYRLDAAKQIAALQSWTGDAATLTALQKFVKRHGLRLVTDAEAG